MGGRLPVLILVSGPCALRRSRDAWKKQSPAWPRHPSLSDESLFLEPSRAASFPAPAALLLPVCPGPTENEDKAGNIFDDGALHWLPPHLGATTSRNPAMTFGPSTSLCDIPRQRGEACRRRRRRMKQHSAQHLPVLRWKLLRLGGASSRRSVGDHVVCSLPRAPGRLHGWARNVLSLFPWPLCSHFRERAGMRAQNSGTIPLGNRSTVSRRIVLLIPLVVVRAAQ